MKELVDQVDQPASLCFPTSQHFYKQGVWHAAVYIQLHKPVLGMATWGYISDGILYENTMLTNRLPFVHDLMVYALAYLC